MKEKRYTGMIVIKEVLNNYKIKPIDITKTGTSSEMVATQLLILT